MEIPQVPERKILDPEIREKIMDAVQIATQSPDFSLHAQYLAGSPETAQLLMSDAVAQFEQVIDADAAFVEWAYHENEKLDGAHYPFHRGSYHAYDIALYQSMLLAHFTREDGPLAELPQEIAYDIIYSGIAHETGLPEGRADHEKRGADKVIEKSPDKPLRSFGVTATTVSFTQIDGKNVLVQQDVWDHKKALTNLDQVLTKYNLTEPLTQEQKELLLSSMVYPDVKGLIIPSATTETGVIASALENVLTLPGEPLPLDIIKSFDGAVGGTAMLIEGIHTSMRTSPIYERLLKEFKIPGSTDSQIFKFVMDNQPFYTQFFKSIQASIPRTPAPTEANPDATQTQLPAWYPYLERTVNQFTVIPTVEESNLLVSEFYNVLKFSMAFEHLIDSISEEKRTSAEDLYLQFLDYVSNPSLSYADIEQAYFNYLGQALELSSSQDLSV